jgi:PAS domain-containing protein
MRNRDGALRWLWALGAGLLAFAVGALPAYRSYLHARDAIEREFYQMLLNTALAAATTVDPELHKTFRPGEETTEKYRRAIEPLAKIQATNPKIKFIYTFIRKDGKIYFVLDATPPGDHDNDGVEDKSYIGDEYPKQPTMHTVLDYWKRLKYDPVVRPLGQAFVSAYVPLRDRTGRVIGALGVDITAADYLNTLGKAEAILHQNLLLAAGLAALVGWGVWLFLSYRARVAAEQQAQRAQLEFMNHIRQQILEHAPLLVFACDAEGNLQLTEGAALRHLPPPPENQPRIAQSVRDDARLSRNCCRPPRRASRRSDPNHAAVDGTLLPHLLLARVRRRRQPRLAGGSLHR